MNPTTRFHVFSAMVLITALVAGCGETAEKVDSLRRKNDEQAQAILRLTQSVEELRGKVDAYERRQQQTLEEKADAMIAQRFGSSIQEAVKQQVAQQIEARDGLRELITDRVSQEVAAIDAQKEQARLAEEQARAEEREQRRQEFMNQRWAQLAQQLNLDEPTTTKLRAASEAIRTEIHDAMQQMRESGTFDPETVRQQMEGFRQKYETEMAALLTPEQLEAAKSQPALRMFDFGMGRETRRINRDPQSAPQAQP